MPKTEALAVRNEQALATLPDYLREMPVDYRGSENVEQDDILIPRLLQAQSENQTKQMDPDEPSYIEGLRAGDFFNSVTGRVYGQRVTVVPLYFFKTGIEFKPQSEGGGVRKIYQDVNEIPKGEADFTEENGERVKPKVTLIRNRMCLILSTDAPPEPIVVGLKGSNIKEAKKWSSLIKATKRASFARYYSIDAIKLPSPDGQSKFSAVHILPGEFVPKAFYDEAEAYFTDLQKAGVKIDTSGIEEEENQDSEPAAKSSF